jgi:hypothetical protein
MSTSIPIGTTSIAGAVGGMGTGGTGLGVADGTGPLLQHVTGAAAVATPLTGAAWGATTKTALAAKTAAIGAAAGGVVLFGLLAVTAAGIGYLGYRLFSANPAPEPGSETPLPR